MVVTLIVIALAGPPGVEPDRFQRQIVVGSVAECQAFIAGQVDEVLISLSDVQSVAATCMVTVGKGLSL